MHKQPLDWSPSAQLLFLIFLTFISTIGISLVSIIAFMFVGEGFNLESLSSFSNPSNINTMKLLQAIQSIGIFFVPPLFMAFLFSNSSKNYLSWHRPRSKDVFWAVLSILVAVPLMNGVAALNQNLDLSQYWGSFWTWIVEKEESTNKLIALIVKVDNIWGLLINIVVVAVLPAIGEELFFRGIIQKQFCKIFKNPHLAIWITAFIFSAFHFQFLTFLARFFMGALLGYLFYWSNSLLLSISAHFANNAFAVIMAFSSSEEFDKMMEEADILSVYGIIAMIISAIALLLILRKIYRQTSKIPDDKIESFPDMTDSK